MKISYTILLLICLSPTSKSAWQQAPDAVPVIRLDKTRFALGESVFFWVGVEQTSRARISKQYQETCRLTITRPDGTQSTEAVGWPLDGPQGNGWMGGSGLGSDEVQLGRYALVFEFAGRRTPPHFLFVEGVPIMGRIKTSFAFGRSGRNAGRLELRLPTPETVTLSVHNGSDQTLRFPRLGGAGRGVSVSIRKADGSYSNSFFYPDDKLSDQSVPEDQSISFDQFTWNVARELPTATLKPGETHRQILSLQAALDEAKRGLPFDVGEYEVTFSTELQVLVGEEGGQWAELSPVRIAVGSTATCVITP